MNRLKEVIIEYVPYWVYNFNIKAAYAGVIKESVTTGNTTVTDTYSVTEAWDLGMEESPVDASEKMPDMQDFLCSSKQKSLRYTKYRKL